MYRILCDRSPARELGSGLTWLKQDGRIVEFLTMAEAGAKAKELNESRNVNTVKYTAHEFDPEGPE
ncbi:MAG: hypothetical protein WCH75_14255 [Candidatus Binatia bacterium]|jgi:hypothetical protein